MPLTHRQRISLTALALCLLLLAGCGDPSAEQPEQDNSPPARSASQLGSQAEQAIEVLPGYWIGELRHVLDDDSQRPEFHFLQQVSDLGQVYLYLLDPPPEPGKEPLSHEYFCLSANGDAITNPSHWVFREASVLVFDELPTEASQQAWKSFQEGEEYTIGPDCWMRRKYLVHEVDDDHLLLMQPPRMAGWLGAEDYEELGIKGVVVELTRLTEEEYRELLNQRHAPYYD